MARTAKILLDEFRGGKLGRITLELPEDITEMLESKAERESSKAVEDKVRKQKFKSKETK